MVWHRQVGRLTNLATSQAQIQSFELANPKIHPIYEMQEHIKGPVLQIQSCKISMIQGNNRRSERSPSEDQI